MSGGLQARVVGVSRIILYEDNVIRKTAKLRLHEPMTLTTAIVTSTLSSGKDVTCVELSACKRSAKEYSAVEFQINLSGSHWSYHLDVEDLKLIISDTDASGHLKKHVLKMESRTQLAAWAAELIQASTFQPEHEQQHCFHVAVRDVQGTLSPAVAHVQHGVLQIRHPADCKLVVCDPLSLAVMRKWDLTHLESFVVEFSPNVCLRVQPLEPLYEYRKQETIYFLSTMVAQESLTFIESVFQNQLPQVFQRAERLEYRDDTSQGRITKAVVYNLKKSRHQVSVKKSKSSAAADGRPHLRRLAHYSSYDDAHPYAVSEIFPKLSEDTPQIDKFSVKPGDQLLLPQRTLPPSNLTRPGVAVARVLSDSYVEMLKTTPPEVSKQKEISIDSAEEVDDDYEDPAAEEADDDCEDPASDEDDYENTTDNDTQMAAGVITTSGSELHHQSPDGSDADEDMSDDYTQMAAGMSPSISMIGSEKHSQSLEDSDSDSASNEFLSK